MQYLPLLVLNCFIVHLAILKKNDQVIQAKVVLIIHN